MTFQFHTILEYADEKYRRACSALCTRKVFLEILRSLMILIVFDSLDTLLNYMSHEHHEITQIDTGLCLGHAEKAKFRIADEAPRRLDTA